MKDKWDFLLGEAQCLVRTSRLELIAPDQRAEPLRVAGLIPRATADRACSSILAGTGGERPRARAATTC